MPQLGAEGCCYVLFAEWFVWHPGRQGQYDDGKAHLQQKVHQYTAELHNALGTLRPGASKPPGDRPMTFEERRKLSIALSRLQGDSLARVVQIVGEDPCYTVRNLQRQVSHHLTRPMVAKN